MVLRKAENEGNIDVKLTEIQIGFFLDRLEIGRSVSLPNRLK